jgi:REP element-mobilizing transposase RayT
MTYNPAIHHRRSIRLKGYDYSQAGLYFITICCQDRICRFGHIENSEMVLNELGMVACNEWAKLPERFPNFELDVFQIMPNHIHGIIILNEMPVGAGFTPAQNDMYIGATDIGATDIGATARVAPTVSDIVGAYKSLVANECLKLFKINNETMGKLWQRNYHEHIIRDEQSYLKISEYIINNPANWDNDSLK